MEANVHVCTAAICLCELVLLLVAMGSQLVALLEFQVWRGPPPPRTVKDSNTSDAWRSWSIIPTWTVSLVKVSIVGLISLSLEQRFSSRVEHPNHSSSKKQKTKTRFPSSTSDYGFGIPGCPRGRSCADRMGNVASWNHPWVTRGAGSGWEWASFEDRGASF